jgi:hypothetical protein
MLGKLVRPDVVQPHPWPVGDRVMDEIQALQGRR